MKNQNLEQALRLHREGKLEDAYTAYSEMLAATTSPTYPLIHMLGLVCLQTGRIEESESFFNRALGLNKNDPALLNHYALLYRKKGEVKKAESALEAAIKIDPDYPETYNNQGNLFSTQGRVPEAEKAYLKALSLNPHSSEASNNLGLLLMRKGDLPEATKIFEAALKQDPNNSLLLNGYANTHINLGNHIQALEIINRFVRPDTKMPEAFLTKSNVLKELGRLEEAISCCKESIKLRPSYAEAYNNLALLYVQINNLIEAKLSLDQALKINTNYKEAYNNRGLIHKGLNKIFSAFSDFYSALNLDPNYTDAYNNLGNLYKEQGIYALALKIFQSAIDLKPNSADLLNNRGATLYRLYKLTSAKSDYYAALKLKPNFTEACINLGTLYLEEGDHTQAETFLQKALAMDPNSSEAAFNLSLVYLSKGDFTRGFSLYEKRWEQKGRKEELRSSTRAFTVDCNPHDAPKILIYAEQGLGDTIQFARYVNKLSELGFDVVFEVQDALVQLMSTALVRARVVSRQHAMSDYAVSVPLLSLPKYFVREGVLEIPEPIRLKVDSKTTSKWDDQLNGNEFKIGITWQGSKDTLIDLGRSFGVHFFREINTIPNIKLYSLQKDTGLERFELEGLKIEILENLDGGAFAFLDTLSVLGRLDLVITSDTSLAHVSGSFGIPTWVLLKKSPDWRWGINSEKSEWYPSVTLFRQERLGDWMSVFDKVKARLCERISLNLSNPSFY